MDFSQCSFRSKCFFLIVHKVVILYIILNTSTINIMKRKLYFYILSKKSKIYYWLIILISTMLEIAIHTRNGIICFYIYLLWLHSNDKSCQPDLWHEDSLNIQLWQVMQGWCWRSTKIAKGQNIISSQIKQFIENEAKYRVYY